MWALTILRVDRTSFVTAYVSRGAHVPHAIERHEIIDRATWLEWRKRDVTASRVGALFGCHPYVSALKLYLSHSGIDFPQEETGVMRRGRLLEGAVALGVAEARPEWTIEKNRYYYRMPELRLGGTPDFIIHNDPRGIGILQTKTAAPHVFDRDYEQGKRAAFWIVLQALTEMMLTEAAFGAVAVMQVDAFDLDIAILEIERHASAEAKIIAAVEKFWRDVAAGNEPTPDYGRDADLIPYLIPRAQKDKTIDLSSSNELPVILAQRAALIDQVASRQKRIDAIETEIKFMMRDAERIVGIDRFSVTWKNQHREPYSVPAKDFRVMRIHDRGVNDE